MNHHFTLSLHASFENRALPGLWLIKSTLVLFQCTALLNPFHLLWTKPLQLCKAHSIVTIFRYGRKKFWQWSYRSKLNETRWRDDKREGAKKKKKKHSKGAKRQKKPYNFFFYLIFFFFKSLQGGMTHIGPIGTPNPSIPDTDPMIG
jgi:hypothetical protein